MTIKYNDTNINLVQLIVIFVLAVLHDALRLLVKKDIIRIDRFLTFADWENTLIYNWIEI